ncbi:MAG: GNAT family N-acetyltransferase [Anaerolineales bacterium]|nr:GNAT family N-acetyltransferase [Anaerolineales bacterium]
MNAQKLSPGILLKILEEPGEMGKIVDLQQQVWPGSLVDIVPAHVLTAAVHNGGLVIGAWFDDQLAGFVFGIPGIYETPDGPRLKHYSHMLGVHPDFRGQGIGFALKRAQWQMVRRQGIDRITWTYDPLLSRNAWLNITRLGAVCDTYLRNFYGEMQDDLNRGLRSDRFQVDWWVNSKRVNRRLSRRARLTLDLAHYLAADASIINPSEAFPGGWPRPANGMAGLDSALESRQAILLLEIPADFLALKAADMELAVAWREHSANLFENLFANGYLVTDFVHLPGIAPRSFYVLSHGEARL